MEFSHHNYELYVLDFLEGKLSPEDEGRFRDFLDLNPDLKQMMIPGTDLSLQPGNTIYPNKEFLKRTTSDLIETIPKADLECISLLEKGLDQGNGIENILASFNSHSDNKLFLLYKKTFLRSGHEIFSDKSNLKKPIPVRKQFYWWGSVAAILLLGLMIKVLLIPDSVEENISENSGNNILLPTQNTGQENLSSEIYISEKTNIPFNSLSVEKLSDVPVVNSLTAEQKTQPVLRNTQSLPLNGSQSEVVYKHLSPLPLRTGQISLLEKQLKPPVIYVPRALTQQNLLALENYSIENFRVELLSMNTSKNPAGRKFISAVKSTIELVSALTGGNIDINTSYNNYGRLTSLDLTSEHLKFSTQRKSD